LFDPEVQSWLSRCPGLRHAATDAQLPVPDRLTWHEKPDDESCFVCGGSGLVQSHVLQRFADPAYDAVISAPVRCGRTRICGWERLRVFGEKELSEVQGHRWANRNDLYALPKAIADRWARVLREEARAWARQSPEERAEQRQQIRESLARLSHRHAIRAKRLAVLDLRFGVAPEERAG